MGSGSLIGGFMSVDQEREERWTIEDVRSSSLGDHNGGRIRGQ